MKSPYFSIILLTAFWVATVSAQTITTEADARNRTALEAAEQGLDFQLPSSSPLQGWAEYARLRRDIDTLSPMQAQAFLQRYAGQAVVNSFRESWLVSLGKRQDWTTFRDAWQPVNNQPALRCNELNARAATGAINAQWTQAAQSLWLSTGKSLPNECDDVFSQLSARGELPAAQRWQRFDLAVDANQPGVMRSIARGMSAEDAALANQYASFISNVSLNALHWPQTERSRRVAAQGLAQLAESAPDQAELLLPQYVDALKLNTKQSGQVLYAIALWTVASYGPDSARRLNAVPESSYDERLHEWRAREAMARGDWPAALAAIRKMPTAQREDSRWRYFEARMAEKTGDPAEAQRLFKLTAQSSTFHGFLAADRLKQSYALCAWIPRDSAQARAAIANDPAILRAMALWRIDRVTWATREWNDALSRFSDEQRRIAVGVARDNGWFDRAVFSLGKQPEELRLYELRFPLHHDESIRRESARHAIDPAWVAAEIRAESTFNPRARSAANAMGLMQVLPGTGASVAARWGLPWAGAASLYDVDTNIALGTAYLRQLEDQYSAPYIAIAAYNAGPNPAARWLSQRPNYDPDIWIETISYKETREYVARILAFSVIYDWRLNQTALSVTDRMLGRIDGQRRQFACPSAEIPRS